VLYVVLSAEYPSEEFPWKKETPVPALTASAAEQLEHDANRLEASEIAGYLQEQLGQRVAAYLAGLSDTRQIGRYARQEGAPSETTERRLREGYKAVRMITDAYNAKTAKAWLFGTNSRLDDEAPIEVLGQARATEQFAAVVRAARQFASFA
jgi:hypothetical protein